MTVQNCPALITVFAVIATSIIVVLIVTSPASSPKEMSDENNAPQFASFAAVAMPANNGTMIAPTREPDTTVLNNDRDSVVATTEDAISRTSEEETAVSPTSTAADSRTYAPASTRSSFTSTEDSLAASLASSRLGPPPTMGASSTAIAATTQPTTMTNPDEDGSGSGSGSGMFDMSTAADASTVETTAELATTEPTETTPEATTEADSTTTTLTTTSTRDPNWKPNVLFIVSDDYSERPEHDIPNLNLLANTSVYFPRAYANWPKCAPSRTSFMSGRTPGTLKVFGGWTHIRSSAYPNLVSMPEYFKQNGYYTAGIGKTYHDNDPPRYDGLRSWSQLHWPFPDLKPTLGEFEKQRRPYSSEKTDANPDPVNKDSKFFDYEVASKTVDLIDDLQDKDDNQPWFINVGFRLPHGPWQMPIKYFDRYEYDDFTIENKSQSEHPANFPDLASAWGDGVTRSRIMRDGKTLGRSSPIKYNTGIDFDPRRRLPELVIQELRRGYAASISFMDAQLGRLLDRIYNDPDLVNNTIIAFTSDHGYMLSELGQWKKQVLYELGLRVPLYIRDPRFVSNHGSLATTTMAELVDIYPTLADLAGLSVPAYLDGTSLAPAIRAPTATPRDFAISQSPRCKPTEFPQRLYDWARNECKRNNLRNGPGKGVEVMGFTIRTQLYRYTMFIAFDYLKGQALWDRKAEAVELFDHRHDDEIYPAFEDQTLVSDGSFLPQQTLLRAVLHANVDGSPPTFAVAHSAELDVGLPRHTPANNLVYINAVRPQYYAIYDTDVEACWQGCAQDDDCLGLVVLRAACIGLSNITGSIRVDNFPSISLRKL